mmetsp:Transcript_4380/g.7703  ORF Transcript_4380/g.7703 Transcript_4380/m.7703 type:complete len:92 (+) Transcript_4380:212-487(+)
MYSFIPSFIQSFFLSLVLSFLFSSLPWSGVLGLEDAWLEDEELVVLFLGTWMLSGHWEEDACRGAQVLAAGPGQVNVFVLLLGEKSPFRLE